MRVHWMIKAACAEPYRVLFPLGLLGAALGLGVWIPHALWPASFGYPGAGHAVLQIQGFLLCFVFGFLGTMLPKVHGVAPLGLIQFLLMPLGLIVLMAAALLNAPVTAQFAHLALLINFIAFMLLRWPQRRGNPPSFFVFIAAAILVDFLGTLMRITSLSGFGPAQNIRFSALLQYQAFPLLLVLGVGGFLLPKLFASEIIDPARLKPSGTGTAPLVLAAVAFVSGYAIEAWLPAVSLSVRLGNGVRAAVWLWFLLTQMRLHRLSLRLPIWLEGARWSLWLMGAGMILAIALPRYLLAWEHLVFIAGILWLTMTVATRVLTAHAGRLHLLDSSRRVMLFFGGAILLAALTRVSTEIWPGARLLHLALAAGFALTGLAVWSVGFATLVRRFPGDGT